MLNFQKQNCFQGFGGWSRITSGYFLRLRRGLIRENVSAISKHRGRTVKSLGRSRWASMWEQPYKRTAIVGKAGKANSTLYNDPNAVQHSWWLLLGNGQTLLRPILDQRHPHCKINCSHVFEKWTIERVVSLSEGKHLWPDFYTHNAIIYYYCCCYIWFSEGQNLNTTIVIIPQLF